MKNIIFVVSAVILIFSACSNENNTDANASKGRLNMLLPSSVPVSQIFLLDSIAVPGWLKGFKTSEFIQTVFNKAMNSEITVYDPSSDDTSHVKSTKEDILNRLDQQKGLLNLSEIKSLFFKEEWFLDTTDPFLFEKKINCWYPVRHYQAENIDKMKLIFKASGGNPTELLAKNVIYELNLDDTLNPEFTVNLNTVKLTSLIINKVLNGKAKGYNPLDTNYVFTKEQILSRMGAANDTLYVDDLNTGEQVQKVISVGPMYEQITSLIFVEDWYIDPKTYAIKKVIKGIGPVRHYMKGNENIKNIVFILHLSKEKTKLFN
jgi:hypothetical protein